MKKIIIILFVKIVLVPYAIAQGIANYSEKEISNYIRTYSFTATNAQLYNLSEEHFDGLGRKSKSVNLSFAPNNTHIISSVAYDDNGREWKNFLPVPHNDRSSSNSLYMVNNIGEWIYKRIEINAKVGTYTIAEGERPIDNVRVYPKGEEVVSYTWFPRVGVRSSTDGAGNIQTYEYDVNGRLQAVYDVDGNPVIGYYYRYRTSPKN